MTTWRVEPDDRRTLYVTSHRAYAAAMAEDGALTEAESERLAAALREIDAKKAAISDDAVHYAPGDSPFCG